MTLAEGQLKALSDAGNLILPTPPHCEAALELVVRGPKCSFLSLTINLKVKVELCFEMLEVSQDILCQLLIAVIENQLGQKIL